MEAHTEVDNIWRSLSTWGRYQVFQLTIVLIDFIPCAFTILGAVFTGYVPNHRCAEADIEENNLTQEATNLTEWISYDYGKCGIDLYDNVDNKSSLLRHIDHCPNGFTYSVNRRSTYSAEWNLVCSRFHLAALAQSLVLAGQGIGAMFFSHLADRFGRKTIHVFSHLGVTATAFVMAFSTNIQMILALRLIAGTFQQGMVCTGKILALEIFPTEARAYPEAMGFIAWSLGVMLLAPMGYFFKDLSWRYLQFGILAWSFYSVLEWWIMDESVRWLLVNNRTKEAERVLRKAARWNKINFDKIEQILNNNATISNEQLVNVHQEKQEEQTELTKLDMVNKKEEEIEDQNDATEKEKLNGNAISAATKQSSVEKYSIIDIMKDSKLRVNTVILWYCWAVTTGTYYGLLLVSSHLAGNRFFNFFLSGLCEVPALCLEFYLFNKIGRKKTLILFNAVTGLSLIISTALLTSHPDSSAVSVISTALSLIGKTAITGSFSTVFLYTPELYPTNYRNSGLGVSSSISRIGAMLAPFASNLAVIALWIPGAIFGGLCLLGTVLCLKLPESMQHELPASIKEIQNWSKEIPAPAEKE